MTEMPVSAIGIDGWWDEDLNDQMLDLAQEEADAQEAEVTEKPKWAVQLQNSWALIDQARTLAHEAQDGRCPARDSGGAQCTADRTPEHAHRHREEDLP